VLLFIISICSCQEHENKNNINANVEKRPVEHNEEKELKFEYSSSANKLKFNNYFHKLSKYGRFKGVVLVADESGIIFDTAIGFANYHTRDSLTVNSSFHLASVSKQFTAMGIMILKEEGKLNFDDPVEKYIKSWPYKGITIRHLLNHTSGVANILNYIDHFLQYWDTCQIAENKHVPFILKHNVRYIENKPGNRFSYNNTNYVLLATLIEEITGASYAEFIAKKIFRPLKMNNSTVYNYFDETNLKNRAIGYNTNGSWYSKDENDIRNGLIGDKGIYSTVRDLYLWDQALYTNRLVSQKSLDEAFSYSKNNKGQIVNYGFGWRKSKNYEDLVYHFGHWRGFNACMIRIYDQHKTVIILNNTNYRHIKSAAEGALNILYEGNVPPEL
jgi:CubicO group peptidase (beta-lactamase class C family)